MEALEVTTHQLKPVSELTDRELLEETAQNMRSIIELMVKLNNAIASNGMIRKMMGL